MAASTSSRTTSTRASGGGSRRSGAASSSPRMTIEARPSHPPRQIDEEESLMNRSLTYAALASACLVGCGGSDVSLVPVSGTVTLEGKPLAGAQISFAPESRNAQGTPGTDITGSSGYYKVMTAKGRTG